MEERFPMMNPLPGRLARLSTRRAALWLAPLMLLGACATPIDLNAPATAPAAPAVATAPASLPPLAPVETVTPTMSAPEVTVAPVPVDPLRPDVPVVLDDRSAQTDLWERVRRGFAMPELDSTLVRNREQWYAKNPDYVQRMTERGGRYMFHIVEELERRGLPTELALLPFVESAFNPQALSSARASGMWQFMAATGKHYKLKQNIFRDDRRDVLASTRAALDYLQRLNKMFGGDWQLALAAYNWGEGNVQRAIARNQKLGLPTTYAALSMPLETQNYLPKLQATKNIVLRPADFNLALPALKNHPYFLSVPIERDMDVAVAVKLAGLPLDEFQHLNPQMNRPVILAAGTPQVLLPYDNANRFVRQLPQHRGPLASWTAWTAPKTLRPADAAKQFNMSEEQLREVNHIPPRMLVTAGSTLLVPRAESRKADVSIELADNATLALAPDLPPMRRMALKAGRRDSVATVAKRYHVAPTQVAQWNNAGASFRPGQTIVVFVAAKTASPSKSASPGKAASRVVARGGKAPASASTRVAARVVKPAAKSSPKVAAKASGHPSGRNVVVKRKPNVRVARSG
jgi:membrane-bound lytic murein transglycosylase D